MPRPLWNGQIGFGLVNVPVKLFRATSPKDVRFHQLHEKDGIRIQQKRVCPADGEEVPYDEIVKGFEVGSDRYVVIDPEELRALDPKASHTIEIHDFVELDQIDPVYFDSAYYVVPDARAHKAYALLVEAMTRTNRVGIAKFVMRTKEYLCAVRPKDGGLVLETMLFADEVVSTEDLDLPSGEVEVSDRELKIATQLVESLATDFEPEKYKDEYREKVLAMIDAKIDGQELTAPTENDEPAPVVDLMAALEASLAKAKDAKSKAGATKAKGAKSTTASKSKKSDDEERGAQEKRRAHA